MESFLTYFLKVNGIFSCLFLLYYLFCRKEKFLLSNRLILLSLIFVSIFLPLCPALHTSFNFSKYFTAIPGSNNSEANPIAHHETIIIPQISNLHTTEPAIDYRFIPLGLYSLVGLFLILSLLLSVFKITRIALKSQKKSAFHLYYYQTETGTSPFSFFKWIFIPSAEFENTRLKQVLLHEKVHADQWHSIDVLLTECFSIFIWMNPLVYLYKKQLKLNLEFLADEHTLKSGIEARDYQLHLVLSMTHSNGPINAFYSSKVKSRIYMMNKGRSKPINGIKYLMFLPAFAILYAFTTESESSSAIKTEASISLKQTTTAKQALHTLTDKFVNPPKSSKKSVHAKAPQTSSSRIDIDARTDTVKIKLVKNDGLNEKKFKGIYVFEDQVFSDAEIRSSLKANGSIKFVLPNRPVIGVYTKNDSTAIKTWGKKARNGVVYMISKK